MTRRLVVLLSDDDLRVVDRLCPEALRGDVIAFDLDVHLTLLDRGVDHLTPFDIVGPGELERLRAFDAAVQNHWMRHATATYRDVDLLALARYRHVSALRRLSWAVYATERFLDERRPDEVVTFDEPTGHGLHQPPGSNQMPLLFAALRGGAERRGIRVELLDRRRAGMEPWVDHAARGSRDQRGGAVPSPPEDAWILCYGDGSDLVRQGPLVRRLRADGETVVHAFSAAPPDTVAAATLDGHAAVHVSRLGDATVEASTLRTAQTDVRRRFDEARRDADRVLVPWLANRHLDIHLAFIFGRYLAAMAEHVERWTGLFRTRPPALVVSQSPVPMADLASACGIPVLHVAHGLMTLGEPDYFSLMHGGTIAAIGPTHAQRLTDAGIDAARVRVTGDPHVDALVESIGDGDPRRATSAALRPALGLPEDGPVVLLLSGTMAFAGATNLLPFCDFGGARRSYDDLASVIERRPTWTFVAKCHPRWDHPGLFTRLNRRLPANCRIRTMHDAPLHDLVAAADAVVLANAQTSALVEASLWQRPVLYFDTSLQWWDHDRWGTSAWPVIDSVEALERALHRMLSSRSSWAAAVARTESAVRQFLGEPPGRAVDRCAALAAELRRGSILLPAS